MKYPEKCPSCGKDKDTTIDSHIVQYYLCGSGISIKGNLFQTTSCINGELAPSNDPKSLLYNGQD